MATTSDFKRGMRLLLDGDPWVIVEYSTQSPTARGGNTLVRARLRNLRTQQLVDRSFKAGERISQPDFEYRNCQYLYEDTADIHVFMDQDNYEQFGLPREDIDDELGLLTIGGTVKAMFFEGRCIGIELAPTVTLTIARCDPGVRGDTVNNATKAATLETGLEIQVPLFVEEGEQIVVDTRDARYVRRA